MNRRINKILLDILHEKEDSLVNYAKLFDVSEQTIRNDIKEINFQLESNNGNKAIYLEDGFLQIPKEVNLKELFKTYASFQHYHLTLDERRTILALLLVTSHDYVTTYYLSEYLLVSRNTLVSDIEALKKWFVKNNLVLLSHIGKGYKVVGDELDIRSAMTKLVIFNGLFDYGYDYAMGWENNIFQNLLLEIIDPDTRYQDVSQLLMEAEKEEQLQLSDFSYQEVICYLIIMIERIKFERFIEASDMLEEIRESSKSSFAQTILKKIEERFAITTTTGELDYLISVLRRKSYIKNNGRKIDSIEIQILINEFIFNLAEKWISNIT
ncbi:HTH domain-containing protein [Enterococcus avium]